jgi:hypothetical protein
MDACARFPFRVFGIRWLSPLPSAHLQMLRICAFAFGVPGVSSNVASDAWNLPTALLASFALRKKCDDCRGQPSGCVLMMETQNCIRNGRTLEIKCKLMKRISLRLSEVVSNTAPFLQLTKLRREQRKGAKNTLRHLSREGQDDLAAQHDPTSILNCHPDSLRSYSSGIGWYQLNKPLGSYSFFSAFKRARWASDQMASAGSLPWEKPT